MWKLFKFIVKLITAFIILSILQVLILKWMPFWLTPLNIKRAIEMRDDKSFHIRKKWVPLEEISPNMIKAVIASEDNLFVVHRGFDWNSIEKELDKKKNSGKRVRGCSTISQQTAKNAFTFGGRNLARKAIEAYYTFLIEKIWGKRRIMEVYLNIIEMGRGIFGAEAAAEQLFGKSAAKLSLNESALIAACLPNPQQRNAAKPTSYLRKRQGQIVALVPKIDFKFLKEWEKSPNIKNK